MPQYGWSTCPEPVHQQVEQLVTTMQKILLDDLVGVYLHGSLAMNCFNPERSDVDLLVVVRRGMTVQQKREVAKAVLHSSAAPRPIEISFVRGEYLQQYQYPPPFELHYGEDWREHTRTQLASGSWQRWNDKVLRDPDLPGHFMITRTRGVTLFGEPITAVFSPVPPEHYRASILADVESAHSWITRNPVYGILNLCRVYWYLLDGAICSKDEAGEWALGVLPHEHRSVVAHALVKYWSPPPDDGFDVASLERCAEYLDEQIHQCANRKEPQ